MSAGADIGPAGAGADVDTDDDGSEGPVKPKLRGVLHEVAVIVSVASGAWLVWDAPTTSTPLTSIS